MRIAQWSRTETLDQQIVTRYTGQPLRLPADLRRRIESAWDGPVMLYASSPTSILRSSSPRRGWLWARPRSPCAPGGPGLEWEIDSSAAHRRGAGEPGLSATTLTLAAAPDEPPLAAALPNRQRRASRTSACARGGTGRAHRGGPDADREYAEAVAHPVRDAQALVGGRPKAVIWRLLAYLRPYRRELTLGMAAATLIALVSLIPPWLAGYVLDRLRRRCALEPCRSSGRRRSPGSPCRRWRRSFWFGRARR